MSYDLNSDLSKNFPHYEANPEIANLWRPIDYCVLGGNDYRKGITWNNFILDIYFAMPPRWN